MARKAKKLQHKFQNKLVLNQWLISQFGIDPFRDQTIKGRTLRPFHVLADQIKNQALEGIDHDNLHNFYWTLIKSELFWENKSPIDRDQLLIYERNIVSHTLTINERRQEPIKWKYFQWLTLLFTEIYLDRYFNDKESLVRDLNKHVKAFNEHWSDYEKVHDYTVDDLNKLCYQSATGSGKTLLMHVNLLQYKHYAGLNGYDKELSRVILLTPNKSLSEQHISEFHASNLYAEPYLLTRGGLYGRASGLDRIDVLEITTLADQEGPNTIATRSLGDQNLLLVDEGHRGMSGTEEGAWFSRRAALCEKGFTFEYSATFQQAVKAANNEVFENAYTKSVIFDYSYKWFYGDGFGKDYQILNLPKTFEDMQSLYLTACLLKYFQQLLIYKEKREALIEFNMEKPLWVFVGNTVTKETSKDDTEKTLSHVGMIIQFIADFLHDKNDSIRRIKDLLTGSGRDTGLVDKNDQDIFHSSFNYLIEKYDCYSDSEQIYKDIIKSVFNSLTEGFLRLGRLKGESGEVTLKVGNSDELFGLINVGDAKGLTDLLEDKGKNLEIYPSEFTQPIFNTVKDSDSEVNLLIGSKKFIEGWDCWRVSAMGLMHVGKSEGAQIIQLFGRGIRLKGYRKSLKRSGYTSAISKPAYIEDLETLYVFGVEANFMEKFREYLEEEGLPGNEQRNKYTIPLNVTYDFGRKLKVLKPKKRPDGKDYEFKKDGPVPKVGEVPEYMQNNKVIIDFYSKISVVESKEKTEFILKDTPTLSAKHRALLDYDRLYFELEKEKRERSWYNINISKDGIRELLADPCWYVIYIPNDKMQMKSFQDVAFLHQVVIELLKNYLKHYYNYCHREWTEPRLELVDLCREDDLIPNKDESYQIIVDSDATELIKHIEQLKSLLAEKPTYLKSLKEGSRLYALKWEKHLYEPLLHVRKNEKITILPVALNESEYQFVQDLYDWCKSDQAIDFQNGKELYLLRNLSRGKGIGFFEAGGFYPDFILWVLSDDKQYVNFIEPHGLLHGGAGVGSEKIKFHQRIKQIEKRLGDPNVILNSFILSCTKFPQLKWDTSKEDLESQHVLFMEDGGKEYIDKMVGMIG